MASRITCWASSDSSLLLVFVRISSLFSPLFAWPIALNGSHHVKSLCSVPNYFVLFCTFPYAQDFISAADFMVGVHICGTTSFGLALVRFHILNITHSIRCTPAPIVPSKQKYWQILLIWLALFSPFPVLLSILQGYLACYGTCFGSWPRCCTLWSLPQMGADCFSGLDGHVLAFFKMVCNTYTKTTLSRSVPGRPCMAAPWGKLLSIWFC